MKFKEFIDWCHQRAADGYWTYAEALICITVIDHVYKERFWRREKAWKKKYSNMIIKRIIKPVEQRIKGEYEESHLCGR